MLRVAVTGLCTSVSARRRRLARRPAVGVTVRDLNRSQGDPRRPRSRATGAALALQTSEHPSTDSWLDHLGLADQAVLTIDETAKILRISDRTVRERINAGDIPALHFGRRVLIPVPWLMSILIDRTAPDE
jgi:excisionase family DNA binding protein